MTPDKTIEAAIAFGKAERENGTKMRVLLPCNSHVFNRISQNLPKGTLTRVAGSTVFEGTEWQVVEFYKPKKQDTNKTH